MEEELTKRKWLEVLCSARYIETEIEDNDLPIIWEVISDYVEEEKERIQGRSLGFFND